MKKFVAVVIVLAVIGLVLVLGFSKFIGKGIAAGVEKYGPEIMQTTIKLDGVDISVLGGGGINGLVVGNPEGFSSEYAIKLDQLKLKLKPMSVLSEKIVIEEIAIDGPGLIYEVTPLFKSNIGQILKNVEAYMGPDDSSTEEEVSDLKFQVDRIRISNVRVTLASQLSGENQASVVLPEILIENLGQGPEGITIGDIVKSLFKAINEELVSSVVKGNEGLGGSLKNMGEAAEKRVGGMLKGIKDAFKKQEE